MGDSRVGKHEYLCRGGGGGGGGCSTRRGLDLENGKQRRETEGDLRDGAEHSWLLHCLSIVSRMDWEHIGTVPSIDTGTFPLLVHCLSFVPPLDCAHIGVASSILGSGVKDARRKSAIGPFWKRLRVHCPASTPAGTSVGQFDTSALLKPRRLAGRGGGQLLFVIFESIS